VPSYPLTPPGPLAGLAAACGTDPGLVCRTVYGLTGDVAAARWVDLVLAKPAKIFFILLIAFVLRALTHRAINKLAAKTAASTVPRVLAGRTGAALESPLLLSERRQQRMDTVASVLRSVASVAIFAIAIALVLDELGVNLAPIVASAGIVGVAVGFGAQNLVKDFLSGMFMIMEDQYGVGDVIDAGEATGTVEAIGLRTTRLRDVNGVVWYIRNGEILRIGNMSQGWARAVLDIPVSYREDVRAVRELIKKTADELWRDENFRDLVLEEPEVWGVEALGAESVVIRVATKTAPLKQWDVARELRERIKAAFDGANVEIPLPQRSVWVRDSGDGRGAERGE
jgi:small conductance mechanosensitive channel